MKSSTKSAAKTAREISYYRQRYRNRVFSKLVSFITEQAQQNHVTKKDVAELLGKDPGLISRILNQPSNLTLDSISDLLLAFDAEAEPPDIVLFKDRPAPNFMHPLIARVLKVQPKQGLLRTESSGAPKPLPASDPTKMVVKFETATATGR